MVVYALLVVVVFGDVARRGLEDVQVEMLDRKRGTLTEEAELNW